VAFWPYAITRKRHEVIAAELKARRADALALANTSAARACQGSSEAARAGLAAKLAAAAADFRTRRQSGLSGMAAHSLTLNIKSGQWPTWRTQVPRFQMSGCLKLGVLNMRRAERA